MIEIRKHGAVLTTDAHGYLIPDASPEKIVPPWDEAVSFIKDAYIEHLGEDLHSVYIRGSVARGLAIERLSDLDSFALVHGHPPEEQKVLSWSAKVGRQYMKRFPFSAHPEIWIGWVGPLLDNLEVRGAWIKLQCVCVHGEDLIPRIPPVKLKALVERSKIRREYVFNIVRDFHEAVEESADPEHAMGYCRWVCKRFLRAGSTLVMSRAEGYTRDLYYCYESFSKFYPHQEHAMKKALQLALNPTEDIEALIPFVDELGEFLAQEADRVFGLPETAC